MMMRTVMVVMVLAACIEPPELSEYAPAYARCPAYGCGLNTATGPDGEIFDELDWTGNLGNAGGVHVNGAQLFDGTEIKLHAELDRLVGKDNAGHRYEGDALNGTVIRLGSEHTQFDVLVAKVDTYGMAFWGGNTSERVWAYDLQVRRHGELTPFKRACAGSNLETGWFGFERSALIFEGDRYDDNARKAYASQGSTWMNFACAGSYQAKLHLLRHTYAGGFGDDGVWRFPTTIPQRTTYLKALTADYHGDGSSWTISGQPLWYADASGYHVDPSPLAPGARLEAIWNEQGAVCLSRPRRDPFVTLAWVYSEGYIPPCKADKTNWKTQGYVITASPPAPPPSSP